MSEPQLTSTEEAAIRAQIAASQMPMSEDMSPFAVWLRQQVHRKDRVGAFSRVAIQDPTWPGAADRQTLAAYFVKMGARDFVMASIRAAWDEFDSLARRERTKAKRKAAKAARKVNRRKR